MKKTHRFRVAIGLLLFFSAVTATVAADSTERVKKEVVGMWIVDVEGEKRTRTLSVKSAELGQDGIWILESTYGWTDDVTHSTVSAKLTPKADGYNLIVTTQANSVISAEYTNSSFMNGSFVWKSGKVKPVKLERLSSDEIGKRAAIQRKNLIQSAIKSPAADVPASCAGFVGSWTGNWPSYGPKWLWVTEINANCVARYAVTVTSTFPDKFEKAEIKGGVLARSKADGGSEYYELHGEELWARYVAPPGGYSNNAIYRRLHSGGK